MIIPRLMNRSNRTVIIGPTGSGKTVALLYQLARRPLTVEPWVILNFKGDDKINAIARAKDIDYDFDISRMQRGIFVLHPRPGERKELEDFLWRIWQHEKVGIAADEGFMLSDSEAYEAIMTQGRSKLIPAITGTQRPVWVSRFVFSEAEFIQYFPLRDQRDVQTVESFMPQLADDVVLADYYSWYYDVARKQLFLFSPVPPLDEILQMIDTQLYTRKI